MKKQAKGPKFRVGDRVEIPKVDGLKFAGMAMQQDPRNIGTGKIIGIEDVGGVPCPVIRLDHSTKRIIHGYECWWKPAREAGPARGRKRNVA